MSDIKDIIVIGAGASGMTAALYALRNGKSVLVLEQETVGGQISNSPRVENFPSIKEISGSDFSDKLFEQITNLGADFELEMVDKVEKDEDGLFTVTTDYAQRKARAVILAVGVKHRHTGVAGEEELIGNGISYCALCDGAFYKGEDIALIGDANTALQYALLLSNGCKSVTVFTLFDRFFAENYLVKALNARNNIKTYHDHMLTEFESENGSLTGLKFMNKKDGSTVEFKTKGVFIAIGQVPDNKMFENVVELDKQGYILSDETCTTKTPGLFVAGDCRTKKIRQLTTACSDGAVAATAACTYIDTL